MNSSNSTFSRKNHSYEKISSNVQKVLKNKYGNYRAVIRIIIYVLMFYALFYLTDLVASQLYFPGENLSGYQLFANRLIKKMFSLLSAIIPGIILLKYLDKRPFKLLGLGIYKNSVYELLKGMLIGTIIMISYMLVLWLTGIADYSFNGISSETVILLAGYLFVLIISAMYEEILFRGYIFQAAIEGGGFKITILLFSLLFGAAHLSNQNITASEILATISAALMLGILYYKTRSLWMPIGAHFMWNWVLGPVFGMSIAGNKYVKKTLFTYNPAEKNNILGFTIHEDLILSIIVIIVAIILWKSRRIVPLQNNKTIWQNYMQANKD